MPSDSAWALFAFTPNRASMPASGTNIYIVGHFAFVNTTKKTDSMPNSNLARNRKTAAVNSNHNNSLQSTMNHDQKVTYSVTLVAINLRQLCESRTLTTHQESPS